MSVERGVAEATVRIRTPRLGWMILLVGGAVSSLISLITFIQFDSWDPLALLGGVMVAEALLIRTFGNDLTPESARVRGIRRRNVPWSQVQAVLGYRRMVNDRVALMLDSGERLVLRVPSTFWGSGASTAASYGEDFHRLSQWWLAHRGQSWRPICHEAPGAPTPE